MELKRLAVVSFFGGAGGFLALIGVVFASGATFGQRCAAAYASPMEVEQCVLRLSDGGTVYVLPEPPQ